MIGILICRKEIQNTLNEMFATNDVNYNIVVSSIKSVGLKVLRNPSNNTHCITIPFNVKAVENNG